MLSNCAICGDRLELRYHQVLDPLTGEWFSIHRCVRCGLGHTLPQPQDLGRYYSRHYYGERHGFSSRYCVKRRLRLIEAALHEGHGRKMLDIGCGDGSFLLAARRAGWDVAGTELNPGPARGAGLEVRDSLEQFPASATFDCITMWHTLEHMPDILWALSRIGRMLKLDGKLVVAVPDSGGLQARIFGPHWLHADVPRHLYHFDAKALRYCLGAAGMSVQQEWHQEFEYDLMGWSQSALNLLMRQPNVFFDTLRGQRAEVGRIAGFGSLVLGALLTVISLPALALGTLSGQGGTLIVMAVHHA